MVRKSTIPLFILLFIAIQCSSQSCCSGGVPLSRNLGLPAAGKNVLQFNLSYDLNVLNTLKSGRQKLEDNSRNRKTHSFLFQAAYSFTNRLSLEGFLSFIRQERKIEQTIGTDFQSAQGLGDAVVLLKYKLWSSAEEASSLYGGLGARLPIGAFDRLSTNGLVLNAELQPGSGAWDGILWAQLNHQLTIRPSMSLSANATYSLKGTNPAYLGDQDYSFGNELILLLSISDRLALQRYLIDPSLTIRYREAEADEFNGGRFPSTGGQWIFINPAFSFWWNPDWAINANVEFPVFAKLVGTQFSPSYRFNIGLFHQMDFNKRDEQNKYSF